MNKTFDITGPIGTDIEVSVGDVRIDAGDRSSVSVTVVPTDAGDERDRQAAEGTRIDFLDGRLEVKTPRARPLSFGKSGSVEVTIELPIGSQVHVVVGVGDVRCSGRLGECRAKTGVGGVHVEEVVNLDARTGAGNVTADHVEDHVEVTTGSGDVRLRSLDSGAVVKNSNGDTWIGTVRGALQVKSSNGKIAIDVASADVTAKSSNGSIRVGEVARGSIVAETSLGDVEIGVGHGTAAWLDVRSKVGRVRSMLEPSGEPTPATDTVQVRARTNVGDIVISRPSEDVDVAVIS